MRLKVLDEDLYRGDDLKPAHPGDAGIDLRARKGVALEQGDSCKIPLGVAMDLPTTTYGMVGSRSSTLLKFGLLTQEGKIDSGYRGEVHLIAYAVRDTIISRADRIAQLIVVEIVSPNQLKIAEGELSATARGSGGFGSTGSQ